MDDFKKLLGGRIKFLRELREYTQDQVKIGLNYDSSGMISRIEQGDTGMSNKRIFRAAKFFGVHPEILFSPDELTNDQIQMHVNLMDLFKKANSNPGKESKHLPAIKSLLELANKE